MGSDGMTIDSKGNIYLTGKGLPFLTGTEKRSEILLSLKAGLQMSVLADQI